MRASRRRPPRLLLALALSGLLVQAAAAPREDPSEEAEGPPVAVSRPLPSTSTAAGEPQRIADPAVLEALPGARYRLELHAPDALQALLIRHLDLARYQHPEGLGAAGFVSRLGAALSPSEAAATGDAADEGPAISAAEIGRLLAAAPAQAAALLETEGYFQARILGEREDDPAGGLPTLRLLVAPGPQARIERLSLRLEGALAEAGEQDSPAGAQAQSRWRRLQARWSLPQGAGFTQAAWAAAKAELLSSLRANGYPSARIAASEARVEAERSSVELSFQVDSGPLFRIGRIRVEGLVRTPEAAALNVRPFPLGSVHAERLLLDYQEALQRVGLYQGVAVELDADPEQADPATLVLRLREQPLKSATLSLGYSTNTGPRFGGDFTHRRPFGQNLVATTRLKFGLLERLASLELLGDPQPKNYRNLLSLQATYLDAAGAITESQRLRVGRSQDSDPIERLYYLELNRSVVRTDSQRSDARALSGNYAWSRREVNNLIFPTQGWAVALEGGGGYAVDADGDRGPFTRVYGRGLWYQPLAGRGGNWFTQFRAEAGQVIKREGLAVPDALLFRVGGDDSVRGYGYQTLGVDRDGATVGGPLMATASAELLRRLDGRWRDWYAAAFLDAGNAGSGWRDLQPAYGYGLGLRWRSPIGPLRIDLAYGEATGSLRLHVNVGVRY